MKNNILISIIIPSYNRANTVGQTIESIVNQRVNADIEIVIGDDCSTDNAREILLQYKEKYPNIIRLFFWEHNMGLGANWGSCVEHFERIDRNPNCRAITNGDGRVTYNWWGS